MIRKRSDAINCVVVPHEKVMATPLEKGGMILEYPYLLKPWLARIMTRLGKEAGGIRRLELDELGAEVWGLIDGHRTVAQIISLFNRRHRLHPREAEASVTLFIYELGKRGIVGLK